MSMPLEVQPKSCTSVKTASIHSSRSRPKCGAPQAQTASTAPSNGDGQAPSPVRRGAEDFLPFELNAFLNPSLVDATVNVEHRPLFGHRF